MEWTHWFLLVASIGVGSHAIAGDGAPPAKSLVAVPFTSVVLEDVFFAPRIATNRRATVPACLARCEETGRLTNFDVASGKHDGKHQGERYDDSDVYKVLEGIAYTLRTERDAGLEARADAIIDSIAAAQREDGYLNTYFQLVAPDKRWSDIRHGHELYCGGHLIEAGVAYAQATGKTKLLDVARRFADLVEKEFGPKKRLDPCGHPEIELALVKLFRATGETGYLELARFFVEQRGRKEGRAELFGEYAQDHEPVREQTEVVGHAVRAMYLYCAMADVAAETGDGTLLAPLERLWSDVVQRKMYVTGGIGSSADNEGFTKAFDLPNDRAYCETCASIGMALWSQRMLLLTGDAKYADLVELESYNVIPAAVSLSGDRFFYGNPMESDGKRHREPWYRTACCPTNLVRYLPAMGERVYATDGNALYIEQYIASEADVAIAGTKAHVSMQTQYPWDGNVAITITSDREASFPLYVRIPAWCEAATVRRGESRTDLRTSSSDLRAEWARLDGPWKSGDRIQLDLFVTREREVFGRTQVDAEHGRVALARGPVIYALESPILPTVRALAQPMALDVPWILVRHRADWLGGVTFLSVPLEVESKDSSANAPRDRPYVDAVPYCVWDNREAMPMTMWLPQVAR